MGLRQRLHGGLSQRTHHSSMRSAINFNCGGVRERQGCRVAQVKVNGGEADLVKLFVEPTMLRGGVGMQLFHWATSEATALGAYRLLIEADPDAAPFYRRMGAKDCGYAPSGSIPGRMLPKLVKDLGSILYACRPISMRGTCPSTCPRGWAYPASYGDGAIAPPTRRRIPNSLHCTKHRPSKSPKAWTISIA